MGAAASLRHYLLEDRKIEKRIDAEIVLAEQANQLYRDTSYNDLITFEEDIARISAMVLLIAESAGSLAELGAFATNDTIRQSLTILLRSDHEEEESFIRYGPVKKVQNEDGDRVGVFPWRVNGKGRVVKASARQHVKSIVDFINVRLKKVPQEELFRANPTLQKFISIYWILYLSQAMSISELNAYLVACGFADDTADVKNKLFCMKMVGWVDRYTYANKTFWFVNFSQDPFSRYAFVEGVVERDTARRKASVVFAVQKDLKIPRHVRDHVVTQQQSAMS